MNKTTIGLKLIFRTIVNDMDIYQVKTKFSMETHHLSKNRKRGGGAAETLGTVLSLFLCYNILICF